MSKIKELNDISYQVLWLEDEPERIAYEIMLIEELFENAGFQVKVTNVKTVRGAMEKLQANRYALILLDQQGRLPGAAGRNEELKWCGLGVLAWIRYSGHLSDTTVLEKVPESVAQELLSFEYAEDKSACISWNSRQDIVMVTGIAMPETNDFIKSIDSRANGNELRAKTRLLFKPIDEDLLQQYVEAAINKIEVLD